MEVVVECIVMLRCVSSCRDGARCARGEAARDGALLCSTVRAQLEDMLSDGQLAEDGFLLKHVQKNKQGYVSLKLLTCLKKIRILTPDWRVTLAAAASSGLLQVNHEATKVRRREPLPRWLLCSPTGKLLLAWNIAGGDAAPRGPEPASLPGTVLQRFSAYGSVTSLCVLYPGGKIPNELQCYVKHHKELGRQVCAVVKFDYLSEVRKAYDGLKAEEAAASGEAMRVVPLGFLLKGHTTKGRASEDNTEGRGSEDNNEGRASEDNNEGRGSEDNTEGRASEDNNEGRAEDTPSQRNPLETSEEEPFAPVKVSDPCQPQRSSDNSRQSPLDQVSASFTSCSGLNPKYRARRFFSGDCDSQSPWVLSRKSAACALNPKVALHRNTPYLMQKVLRQPHGPDGTKGFHSRGKALRREDSNAVLEVSTMKEI
ncbi:La-related protein 6 [Liparis tanakae]|uniref:La-related protein 6 n=1 Tax=Liparis tanakae TaxID=230148 RepID=A0A4Z2JF05_9TELE|nr:La-related protein 6 [Liparis tanakae]